MEGNCAIQRKKENDVGRKETWKGKCQEMRLSQITKGLEVMLRTLIFILRTIAAY